MSEEAILLDRRVGRTMNTIQRVFGSARMRRVREETRTLMQREVPDFSQLPEDVQDMVRAAEKLQIEEHALL